MADTDNVVALPPRFRDFDQARKSTEPVRFVVRGREYTLPADIPAAPVWNMIRKGVDTTDPKQGTEFLEQIIGVENVNQMLEDQITLPELTAVAGWVAEQYGLSNDSGTEPTANPT